MEPEVEVVVAEVGRSVVDRSTSPEERARALWDEHYRQLAGWCQSLVGDVDVAHDVAAEAFVRLLSKWRTVEEPSGYLYVTALNDIRDRWRRQQRQQRLVERLAAERPAAHDQIPDGWLGDLVRSLPARLSDPVLLHYYADLPVEAVAASLHRPVGTVKRQLAEGRAQLLELVRSQEEPS